MKPRFLGTDQEWPKSAELSALGSQGSAGYKGLEVITHHASKVTYTSDEVTAVCPVTGQPDFYRVSITIFGNRGIESKSLKLYFVTLRDVGMFCEDLSRKIKEDIVEVLEATGQLVQSIQVTVEQKPRGGISIKAES